MKNNTCLMNLLKFILLLQNNSINSCIAYNTRIITLYNKQGSLIATNGSPYYRINKIKDDCVEFLVLSLNDGIYSSTNQYITVNIRCICAVKCIEDVNVNNI